MKIESHLHSCSLPVFCRNSTCTRNPRSRSPSRRGRLGAAATATRDSSRCSTWSDTSSWRAPLAARIGATWAPSRYSSLVPSSLVAIWAPSRSTGKSIRVGEWHQLKPQEQERPHLWIKPCQSGSPSLSPCTWSTFSTLSSCTWSTSLTFLMLLVDFLNFLNVVSLPVFFSQPA